MIHLAQHAPRSELAQRACAEYKAAYGSVIEFDGTLPEGDLIVDAVFGIGLTRAPDAAVAELIRVINAHSAPVLALDVPSGVDSDLGSAPGHAVRAARTLEFIAAKAGLRTGSALDHVGSVGLASLDLAGAIVAVDIGRPDRFWHALLYWNPHSVLWEVTMCVTLYFTVLILESAPIFGNLPFLKQRLPGVSNQLHRLHRLAPYLAVVGLCLSMLPQSSLGATYGVLKARPIWYRPDLSLLFMVSAMAGGISLTVLVSMLAARLSPGRVQVNDQSLDRLALVVGWVLVGYLYFRFWDAFHDLYLPARAYRRPASIDQRIALVQFLGR